jgi:hypothetical protein
MKTQDDSSILHNRQADYEEKNNLQGYTSHLPEISIFPPQRWMMDKKMLEVKMKKISHIF